ncbi:hypothetical protein PN466_01505 [Roseofilum reptotaenium CS-1145]|nr:hypothetical protein [Roseofilum reptotaenium CS-1145]
MEVCQDTVAAMNILHKGMKKLGENWTQYGTVGQAETASNSEGTPGFLSHPCLLQGNPIK